MLSTLSTGVLDAVRAVVRTEDMGGPPPTPVPLAERPGSELAKALPLSLLRFDDDTVVFVPYAYATKSGFTSRGDEKGVVGRSGVFSF